MPDPSTIKQIQKLTGCIAVLCRFIPQDLKKCLPFFEVIKDSAKKKKINWNEKCKKRFAAIKEFSITPPILTRALPRETLKVYLSACDRTVGAVLVKMIENHEAPVYYVSYALKDAEMRYPQIEKLVFSLVTASRKLRHYFQGRQIQVITD